MYATRLRSLFGGMFTADLWSDAADCGVAKGAMISNKENTVVASYASHEDAEKAVKELQRSGFDMKKLSIVGKDFHTDEHPVGFYNMGDRMAY